MSLLQLPIEGPLETISDFLQTNALPHTCKSLWTALRLRHITKLPIEGSPAAGLFSSTSNDFFQLHDSLALLSALFPLAHQSTVTLKVLGHSGLTPKPWGELEKPFVRLQSLTMHCSAQGGWGSTEDMCMLHLIAPAIRSLRRLEIHRSTFWQRVSDCDQSDDELGTKRKKLKGDLFVKELSEVLKNGNALEVFTLDHRGSPADINAQNLRQLAEGLRPHVNLRSFTLVINQCSYSTASLAFLLSALPVNSLTTLNLELGVFRTAAINALSSIVCHQRLKTLQLTLWDTTLPLHDVLRAVETSKLHRVDIDASGEVKTPENAVWPHDLKLPDTLQELCLTSHVVTEQFYETAAASLSGLGWKTSIRKQDTPCDQRGIFAVHKNVNAQSSFWFKRIPKPCPNFV